MVTSATAIRAIGASRLMAKLVLSGFLDITPATRDIRAELIRPVERGSIYRNDPLLIYRNLMRLAARKAASSGYPPQPVFCAAPADIRLIHVHGGRRVGSAKAALNRYRDRQPLARSQGAQMGLTLMSVTT